jgi:hypothetical protein
METNYVFNNHTYQLQGEDQHYAPQRNFVKCLSYDILLTLSNTYVIDNENRLHAEPQLYAYKTNVQTCSCHNVLPNFAISKSIVEAVPQLRFITEWKDRPYVVVHSYYIIV